MSRNRKHSQTARLRYILRHVPKLQSGSTLRDTYRVLLLLLAAIAVEFVFPSQTTPDLPVLEEGMVSRDDVIASISFPVFKSETELTQERAEAASAVAPIFDHRPEIADSAVARAGGFFAAVEQVISDVEDEATRRQEVREVLGQLRISASESQLELLLDEDSREGLRNAVERAYLSGLKPGVARGAELGAEASGGVVLRSEAGEVLVARDSITTMQQFYGRAAEAAPAEGGLAAAPDTRVIRVVQPGCFQIQGDVPRQVIRY